MQQPLLHLRLHLNTVRRFFLLAFVDTSRPNAWFPRRPYEASETEGLAVAETLELQDP
jgi:hypothetical protein